MTGTGSGPHRRRRAAGALRAGAAGVTGALAVALVAGACSSAAPRSGGGTAAVLAAPVTAVADTTPPTSPWSTIAPHEQGSRLGRWQLQNRFLVLAALANQGLATVSRPGKPKMILFRGDLSIPPALRRQGWDHIGDPDSWHGYVFDAYQGPPTATEKLFEVTTPTGATHQFIHPLAPHELYNNSFAAVSPDGQWMVSGEWGRMSRLLVFPTPLVNREVPVGDRFVSLAATISLDRPVSDVQGCVFDSATQLMCSATDPAQLLQVDLPAALDGTDTTARVSSLGDLPLLSGCSGSYEAEGIDYDQASRTLRVEVRPPGKCGLSIAVYDYHRSAPPESGGTTTTSGG